MITAKAIIITLAICLPVLLPYGTWQLIKLFTHDFGNDPKEPKQ